MANMISGNESKILLILTEFVTILTGHSPKIEVNDRQMIEKKLAFLPPTVEASNSHSSFFSCDFFSVNYFCVLCLLFVFLIM